MERRLPYLFDEGYVCALATDQEKKAMKTRLGPCWF